MTKEVFMKKTVIFLITALVFMLTACSGGENAGKSGNGDTAGKTGTVNSANNAGDKGTDNSLNADSNDDAGNSVSAGKVTDAVDPADVSVRDIYEKIRSDVAFDKEMMEMNDDYFSNQFGFDLTEFEDYIFLKSEDIMLAENIIIIKVKDGTDTASVKTILDTFVAEQKSIFASYAPEQSKVIESSVTAVNGNLVYLLMSEKVSELKSVMEKLTK